MGLPEDILSAFGLSASSEYVVGENHGEALRELWSALWPDLVPTMLERECSGDQPADRDMLDRWIELTGRYVPSSAADWKSIGVLCGIEIPEAVTDEWILGDLLLALLAKQPGQAS